MSTIASWRSPGLLFATPALILAAWALPGALSANAATLAQPNVCYASTGNGDGGRLLRIDLTTGAGTLVADITGAAAVPALAVRSDGALFAHNAGFGTVSVCEVDADDGTSTCAGYVPQFRGFAFDANDVLYGVDTLNQLQQIDPATGNLTLIGSTLVALTGLALDHTDGTMYASSSTSLYTLDVSTGVATLVGAIGFTSATDVVVDATGNLFASSGGLLGANQLLSIDKSTGAGTAVGPIGFSSVSGLTYWTPSATDVADATIAHRVVLHANVPNPFNPATTISFDLEQTLPVSIAIFDVAGRRVRTLVDQPMTAGHHRVQWDGTHDDGRRAASGTYLYRLRAQDTVRARAMVLLK